MAKIFFFPTFPPPVFFLENLEIRILLPIVKFNIFPKRYQQEEEREEGVTLFYCSGDGGQVACQSGDSYSRRFFFLFWERMSMEEKTRKREREREKDSSVEEAEGQ